MKYCEQCRVNVVGDRSSCPLCQSVLNDYDEGTTEIFPYIPTIYHQYNVFFRGLIFASIVIGTIAVALNVAGGADTYGWWSLFVLAGIGCLWISLVVAARKRQNIPKSLLYQVVTISILAMLWDGFTGWHGWSVDFVVPIVCISSILTMTFITKMMQQYIEDQLIYFLINALFCLVPLIFLLTGQLRVLYPSLICVVGSVIAIAALLLFQEDTFKNELRKRLHL